MLWRIIKFVLRVAEVMVNFTEGDQLHIKLVIGGNVVYDRTIDVIPGA